MVPLLKNTYTHRKPKSVYYFRGFSHSVSPWYLWAIPSAAEALWGDRAHGQRSAFQPRVGVHCQCWPPAEPKERP